MYTYYLGLIVALTMVFSGVKLLYVKRLSDIEKDIDKDDSYLPSFIAARTKKVE